jgi:hypothetical protein
MIDKTKPTEEELSALPEKVKTYIRSLEAEVRSLTNELSQTKQSLLGSRIGRWRS